MPSNGGGGHTFQRDDRASPLPPLHAMGLDRRAIEDTAARDATIIISHRHLHTSHGAHTRLRGAASRERTFPRGFVRVSRTWSLSVDSSYQARGPRILSRKPPGHVITIIREIRPELIVPRSRSALYLAIDAIQCTAHNVSMILFKKCDNRTFKNDYKSLRDLHYTSCSIILCSL